jgi:hypothetical protein
METMCQLPRSYEYGLNAPRGKLVVPKYVKKSPPP